MQSGIVIVGLGNPGPEYAAHRHNIGFRVVDRLARRLELSFRETVPACAEAAAGGERPFRLLKPLTYMNRSGVALVQWSRARGIALTGAPEPAHTESVGPDAVEEPAPIRPLIVCDDLALPTGSVRWRSRGSSGGQNGLASVIRELGGEAVPRLRLGVAPVDREVPATDWADFVLSPFVPEEAEAVEEMIDWACRSLECYLADGLEMAASRFNRRIRPEAD